MANALQEMDSQTGQTSVTSSPGQLATSPGCDRNTAATVTNAQSSTSADETRSNRVKMALFIVFVIVFFAIVMGIVLWS